MASNNRGQTGPVRNAFRSDSDERIMWHVEEIIDGNYERSKLLVSEAVFSDDIAHVLVQDVKYPHLVAGEIDGEYAGITEVLSEIIDRKQSLDSPFPLIILSTVHARPEDPSQTMYDLADQLGVERHHIFVPPPLDHSEAQIVNAARRFVSIQSGL